MQHKVAVLLWLYNLELTDEFIEWLLPVKSKIHIYLGLCKNLDNTKTINKFNINFDNLDIDYYSNSGADISPFLKQLVKIDPDRYPVFLKAHSKTKQWGLKQQCNWRRCLMHSLVSSVENFDININNILTNKYSTVANPYFIFNISDVYSQIHKPKILKLLNKIGIDFINCSYVAGTIFMGNTKYYQAYNNLYLHEVIPRLDTETGKIDERYGGNYSHAMERIFGIIANQEFGIGSGQTNNITIDTRSNQITINHYNECYMVNNCSRYGKVINIDKKNCTIDWTHPQPNPLIKSVPNIKDYTIYE
tara:strand:+ start:8750 stop:9664 length:915 start_codon:yes stop_codon:yes gene_type:complete